MNYDKLSKLQQIAEGSVFTSKTNIADVSEIRSQKLKEKLKKIEQELNDMYPKNKKKLFETWVQATKDFSFPNEDFKEYYWNKYLSLHPDNKQLAKEDLINKASMEMEMFETPQEKEHFLRDKVSRWPMWLVNEFKDDLQSFSTRTSDANLNKAKQIYKDNLAKRLTNISDRELDPDVSEEAHINDLLKLEKMNLLDVSNTINGRFGVADKKGIFIPASDLQDRSQIFPSDAFGTPSTDEQLLIDDLAPEFIKQYVKGNVNNQRSKINLDNKASEGVAASMLETGALTPDRWSEAFSMFSNPEYISLIKKGMIGEIESGRVKNDEDIVKTIYMALSQYKDLLGEPNNGPNT
jgi:hypothetical protein